jgi:DNA methyltransferase 1-associated protein 1
VLSIDREVTRKKYVLSLENRTPEQIAEEEALYIEIKRLEQNERRFKRDREELLRTLAGVDSGLPDIVAAVEEEGPMGLGIDTKKKKKGAGLFDMDSPLTPSNIISLGPPVTKRAPSAKSAAHGIVFNLHFVPDLINLLL